MSLSGKEWIWPVYDDEQVNGLAQNLKLPPALARLLVNRGICDLGKARAFLHPELQQFYSPWLMKGMDQAVERLLKALESNEKVIIHGDYDADGIAASVILVETLQQLGGRVDYYLPSRFDEGYGLHTEALRQFKEAGASLVVTVDCGINAAEEAAFASETGLDLIITDHHQPLGPIKDAVAVVNPLQKECSYPFKELSGAGIAFKLAIALAEKSGSSYPAHLLDLAALGTAADVVPLLGENRIIVSAGLEALRSLKRVGLKALADVVSLNQDRISSTTLSYVLAPAINAAGRMGEALPAAKLLLEKDQVKAVELAGQLHQANQLRRSVEQKILREAEEAALAMLTDEDHGTITLAAEAWHHGVIGIVASRLVEKFNRPVALIALEGGQGRGSARSIPGYNITAALSDNASLLERFGGHEQAAGFTISSENIDRLRDGLNRCARANLNENQLRSRIIIEAELNETEFEFDLTSALGQLEPFGEANPVPLFGSKGWELESWNLVGAEKKHLKFSVRRGSRVLSPIFFSGASMEPQLERGRIVDLAFRLKTGSFRDKKTLDVEVKDLSYSDSFISGLLEVIDRRNSRDRLGHLLNILELKSVKAAVFAATASRVKKIEEKCLTHNTPLFITSGSINGKLSLPPDLNTLVLYDLPLSGELLKPFFEKVLNHDAVRIYLLFSHEDLKRNALLLDHSLPTEGQLERIQAALIRAAEKGDDPGFPGQAAIILGFKPSPGFWDRAAQILTESGFLENSRVFPQWRAPEGGGFARLEKSSAYLAVKELREKCGQFQRLLLEGTPEQIAVHLGSFINN